MSKKAFQAIAEGLEDAIAFSKGAKTRGRVRKVRAMARRRPRIGAGQGRPADVTGPPSVLCMGEKPRKC